MIQKGQPIFIQATDPTNNVADLNYAARVFDASGPITDWVAMVRFDGASYRLPYTFADPGAYSTKAVVFADPAFTTRDSNYAESDAAYQVVDLSSLVVAQNDNGVTGTVQPTIELTGIVQD